MLPIEANTFVMTVVLAEILLVVSSEIVLITTAVYCT